MADVYQPRHAEDDEESLTDSLAQSMPDEKQPWRRMSLYGDDPKGLLACLRRNWHWLAHGVLLSTSLAFFAASFSAPRCQKLLTDLDYTQKYSSWSPAAEVVKYQPDRFNLTPIMEWSPYVGYGEEVDRVWDHITNNVGDQLITREELDRLGLDPNAIKMKHPRTGVEGYRIGIEVFHQLHCLNVLRMTTYKEWYSQEKIGGDVATDAEDLRGHTDHCIEALRLNLMCQSDIGVFTFKKYPELGVEGHWPDFSTEHVCRNFDDIRDWAMVHSVTFEDEE